MKSEREVVVAVEVIRKQPARVPPNVADYEVACRTFRWDDARAMLDGLPGGGLNIAHECVDRHVRHGRGQRIALQVVGGPAVTFEELADRSDRFAAALGSLGVGRGDRVAVLLGRRPELYVAALGTWKAGAVFVPLFAGFGPEPVRQRLAAAAARVAVTTALEYRRALGAVRDELPDLAHVVVVDDGRLERVRSFAGLLAGATALEPVATAPGDPAILHFTSGTTGPPKAAVHVHEAVVGHVASARIALDLHDGDVFWCPADPGWVTGTSYGIVAPLALGVTTVVDDAPFDADRWYSVIEEHGVTVWYTSPTALRLLMRAGPELARAHDLSSLRFVACVGEPLAPEVVRWSLGAFGQPVHDTWWQSETGSIMVANLAADDVHPGSMGRPLPGITAAVAARTADGDLVVDGGALVLADDGTPGELVLRPGWPSMFRGYLGDEGAYGECFVGGWYRSGDVVRRDPDGFLWFVGRGDDLIKSAGHLVGPFEVESVLADHPAVLEVAVVGADDPVAGTIVRAFVTVRPGIPPTDDLRRELLGFARASLGSALAPREIVFRRLLPRTESGKVVRRLLADRPAP